jgi:hypothetical protein
VKTPRSWPRRRRGEGSGWRRARPARGGYRRGPDRSWVAAALHLRGGIGKAPSGNAYRIST